MESRRLAPLVITVFAALAVIYPVTTATRSAARSSEPRPERSQGKPGSPHGDSATSDFPTAKELVSDFFFSHGSERAATSSPAVPSAYSIEFLIATVPDPTNSRLPHFFDSFVESLESAAEASGYTPDRIVLPWRGKSERDSEDAPSWHEKLYESVPGLILFRDPQHQKLLLVFLVGEAPTEGIHKDAMSSALEQMAQFYSWDPKHSELPPGFPPVATSLSPGDDPPTRSDTFRIMGPSFSGSAVSLRFVLDEWSRSRGNSNVRFQIISGTATAIDAAWLSQAGNGHTRFQATVPPDDETFQAVACYIRSIGYGKIAMLTEANTTYGQNFTQQSAAAKSAGGQSRGGCENGKSPPDIVSLPFPMNISRLRVAASRATSPQGEPAAQPAGKSHAPAPLAQEGGVEPHETLPTFSDLSVQSAELRLANLLSTISREHYNYVGIVATDVRDVTFLAHEVRKHCPATVLFTLNSDLLYAYPDVNNSTRGMVVVTPYPLFNLEQLWTYPYGGARTRLQFPSQAAEGVYNATLALLQQPGKLVDYGKPLAFSTNAGSPEPHKPSLWVTAIGNEKTLPIRLLEWKDDTNYTYSPPASANASKRFRIPRVGRGIYAENSVLVVIVISAVLCLYSILIIGQYWRPEKRGTGWISNLVGDTSSPAYWYECRLFLLCGTASFLAFYFVAMADFCLPVVAARILESRIEASPAAKIAAGLGVLTVLFLLLATHVLISAFRRSSSNQRGSAPEVVIFSLLGCTFLSLLAGYLVVRWLEDAQAYPASGLFTHLRSFDFRGGLSPLLPLSCVAMGACLWAICSFRRLRLIDVLRASETPERPHSWLSFLGVDVRSFIGVRELENSVKHTLESSSVISLGRYSLLMAAGLLVGHYFFTARLVRGLEPRPFYWLFEASFIVVYWALLMEFLRLVFAWRSLNQLLRRFSWHPLLAAFKRYRDSRPNLAKMNLTHPPSKLAALESSVDLAGRLLCTAKTLVAATDTDETLRYMLRQSIPEWESEIEVAAVQLWEALRLQWTDQSRRASVSSPLEMVRNKRVLHIEGNWRQSLKACCLAHHSLFRLMQSLGGSIEGCWSPHNPAGGPPNPAPGVKEFFDQVEEFMVSRMVNFLSIVFPALQNLGYFVLTGLLLMLLAVTSYPFQPRNEFLFFNWVVILSFIGTAIWIFVQMDRDTVLSLLNDTKPGQVNFSRELLVRSLLYVAVPLLAMLGAQFPESLRQVLTIFTAAQGSPS